MKEYQKFQEAREKMYEIENSVTAIATQFKQKSADKQMQLRGDIMLSPQGRMQKHDEYKEQLSAEFIAKAAEMRADFDKAAISADVAAEIVLNGEANKPSDTAVRTFERQFAEFETQLLLKANPDAAFNHAKAFIEKQTEPYFAQKVRAQLPMIIREITTLAGTAAPQYKGQLGRLIEQLDKAALTPEQREAQAYLDAGSRYGATLWKENSVQLGAIQQFVGKTAAACANKPGDFKPVE